MSSRKAAYLLLSFSRRVYMFRLDSPHESVHIGGEVDDTAFGRL
jgi:hypothetical protein